MDFIKNKHLWHSNPNKFQDKFDGRWYHFGDNSQRDSKQEKDIIEYYKKVVHTDPENIFRSLIKICSFTTNPLDIKMWSDYAGSSRGMCFEFDIENIPPLDFGIDNIHKKLFPMIYSDEMIDLSEFVLNGNAESWNNSDGNPNFMHYFGVQITLLKSSQYSFENEWRSLWMNPHYEGPFEWFTPPQNIYLGTRIKPRIKRRVLKMEIDSKIFQITEKNGELIPRLIR